MEHLTKLQSSWGTRVDILRVTTYTEYIRDGNEGYDLAFLVLDQNDIHASCYMDFAYRDPMPTMSMTVCGYPCDKSPNPYQCMYCSDCNDAKIKLPTLSILGFSITSPDFERIQYTCDIAGGVSGGPAYTSFNGNTYVSGVHSHGTSDGTVNLASSSYYQEEIQRRLFVVARQWRNLPCSTCTLAIEYILRNKKSGV